MGRDGKDPSQKELSSYFEELFSSKVPRQTLNLGRLGFRAFLEDDWYWLNVIYGWLMIVVKLLHDLSCQNQLAKEVNWTHESNL